MTEQPHDKPGDIWKQKHENCTVKGCGVCNPLNFKTEQPQNGWEDGYKQFERQLQSFGSPGYVLNEAIKAFIAKEKEESKREVLLGVLNLNKGIRRLISPSEIVDYSQSIGTDLNDNK